MSARQFQLEVRNEGKTAEILISGPIGGSFWDDSGMTEKAFLDALKDIPEDKPLTIGINSEGGSIQDGLGIFNAIKRRKNTTARIDGYAVSIASVIPLAAERVISPKSSIWMIHEPWMMAAGNAEDMLKAAEILEKHGETLAAIYEQETGMSADEVREKMKAETWFRGDEAVSMGFADESPETAVALNSFDATRFKNCPPEILKTICAAAGVATHTANLAEPARTEQRPNLSASPVAKADSQTNPAVTTAKKDPNMSEPIAPVAADKSAEILAKIEAIENKLKAPAPVAAAPVVNLGNPAVEKFRNMEHGGARADFIRNNYSTLAKELVGNGVFNLNTVDSGLANSLLASEAVQTMRTKVAPLGAFARSVSPIALTPRQVINVPLISSAGSIQTNPSNFETGDTVAGDIAVTVNQYSKSFYVSHADGNLGIRLASFAPTNAMVLSEGIVALVTALMTNGNYGADNVIGAAANFDANDLPAILALAKDFDRATLLLDGGHLAYLLPTSRESFVFGEAGAYGFDGGIYKNNLWTGAAADTVGFVCGPDAIVMATGLPANLPQGEALTQETVSIGAGISVTATTWFSRSSRALWGSFDVMFGCAKGDTTQGKILTTQ